MVRDSNPFTLIEDSAPLVRLEYFKVPNVVEGPALKQQVKAKCFHYSTDIPPGYHSHISILFTVSA